ncbi:MAG: hypothetical protein D6796_02075 [Caldilineae bacterium]|nr:MAG: hypothetical protein D6796_02075 [Caldilineae bacterium]
MQGSTLLPAQWTFTTVNGAGATIHPATGGTLVFTDAGGSPTTVTVPPNAVTSTLFLLYVVGETPIDLPPQLTFAGHAFDLLAYRNGVELTGWPFSAPLTVTLHYTDADIAGLDESKLTLMTVQPTDFPNFEWVDVTGVCTPPLGYLRAPAQNWLATGVCNLGEFALFEKREFALYLPLVLK